MMVAAFKQDDGVPVPEQRQIRGVTPGNYVLYSPYSETLARKNITVTSEPLSVELVPQTIGSIDVAIRNSKGEELEQKHPRIVAFHRFTPRMMQDYLKTSEPLSYLEPADYWISVRPRRRR